MSINTYYACSSTLCILPSKSGNDVSCSHSNRYTVELLLMDIPELWTLATY